MSTRYPGFDFKLLIRKGVSYEYLDTFDKFGNIELPPREEFYSSSRGEECAAED